MSNNTELTVTADATAEVPAPRPAPGPSMLAVLRLAVEQKLDAGAIDALSRVFETERRNEAERLFNEAIIRFHQHCPDILKSAAVTFTTRKGGAFDSRFAKFDQMVDVAKPHLLQEGLWFRHSSTDEGGKAIVATCWVFHEAGHTSEGSTFRVPISQGYLSDGHDAASALSFALRRSFQMALGIVPRDEDNDGKGLTRKPPITNKQLQELTDLITETNSDNEKFWSLVGVANMAELPTLEGWRYQTVREVLVQKKLKLRKEKGETL